MTVLKNEITRTLRVKAPQGVAFKVFTQMTSWWPMKTHHIGKVDPESVHIEPRVGGRWFERGADGNECDWGRVLAWEPPTRLMLTWELTAKWERDASFQTEIEALFIAESDEVTRVEFVHRNLDRYGDQQEQMVGALDSEGGWGGMLAEYVKRTESQAK